MHLPQGKQWAWRIFLAAVPVLPPAGRLRFAALDVVEMQNAPHTWKEFMRLKNKYRYIIHK